MPVSKLIGLFLKDITGISFLEYVFRPKAKPGDAPIIKRQNRSPRWLRPSFLLALAFALTITGEWMNFLVLWVFPLMFLFPAIVRWGAICEHVYGHENASVSASSPLIMPTLWNRLILPNLNFSMHPYHHYFPGVSFSNLPAVHDIFAEEKLVNTDLIFDGYGDYLRYILGFKRGFSVVAKTNHAGL